MKEFEFKGYLGSAEVDIEDCILTGRLLFIRDVITYSASDVGSLEAAFREAVDHYLEVCTERSETPDLPCKGTFNVRIGPENHRDAALYARQHNMSLNEVIVSAIRELTGKGSNNSMHHMHHHSYSLVVKSPDKNATRVVSTNDAIEWLGHFSKSTEISSDAVEH